MPGASIIIDDELTPVISAIGIAVSHPGELTAAFAAYLLASTQRRFERQTGPDGTKWPPLSKRTSMQKVRGRRRGTANILRVSTRLYSSLVASSDDASAEVGTNVEYGRVHQLGGEINHYARSQRASFKKIRKRYRFVRPGTKGAVDRNITIGEHSVKIPARPYLGFSEQDRQELIAIGRDWLAQETPR
ncbi:phage virion morphogenesis protein [Pseudorhizobium halotolerans]|uniref:Phage virion morphogenesis protein n=1 Tax=Pseudorhizobium halotolerans TaxID=1233081 RepID=A0ABM8PYX1_9HYPH|nr:phage virion morphogenesis protein [Pseudorhizobium halotolerans]CAD7055438.1 phage virion morphogenesis protein [Pseudorhizobium halotolerans]